MPAPRKQQRGTDRDRRRTLGRALTDKLRADFDDLDFGGDHMPAPQAAVTWGFDESEAEVEAVVEAEGEPADALPEDDVERVSLAEASGRRYLLSDLIGS